MTSPELDITLNYLAIVAVAVTGVWLIVKLMRDPNRFEEKK